jgi:DNA-binding response OmpR family regulator
LTIDMRRVEAGAGLGTLVLAETDVASASQLIDAAAEIGIRTIWCRDDVAALLAVDVEAPDVLVISADTDTIDAASMVAAIRSYSDLPILVGAAPRAAGSARRALMAGASAVIPRPYDIASIAPFAVKVGCQSRQTARVFSAGPIEVDPSGRETRVRGRHVQLTRRELDLLVFLIKQRGNVASAEEISRAVWGRSPHTNTVAVHVKRLREKLGNDPQHGAYIRTVRGAGYRLAPSVCD